jgi:hypothetical protein
VQRNEAERRVLAVVRTIRQTVQASHLERIFSDVPVSIVEKLGLPIATRRIEVQTEGQPNPQGHLGTAARNSDFERYSLLAQLAESQLEARLSDADGIDTKAFGLLAGNIAGVAFISAIAPRWSGWWLVPIVPVLGGVGCLLRASAITRFDPGPDLWDLRRRLPHLPVAAPAFQAFSDISSAERSNRPLLNIKQTWLRRGYWLAIASLVTGLIVLVAQLRGSIQ